MSHSLRYRNAIICEHLASQYVLATMSDRVRARTDKLRLSSPELDAAIIAWSDRMADIDYLMPEKTLIQQQKHWSNIEHSLSISPSKSFKDTSTPFLNGWRDLNLRLKFGGLGFWRLSTALSLITVFILGSILLSKSPSITPILGPSYVAVMSVPNSDNENIHFVVNAYAKTEAKPSRLVVQWSKDKARPTKQTLHIWAEDKKTGEIAYIGVEPEQGTAWHLQKAQWQTVANSRRLIATNTNTQPNPQNILFSGPCIQLKGWRAGV